jgi:hypothetical protein
MLALLYLFARLPIMYPSSTPAIPPSNLYGLWHCEKVIYHFEDSLVDISSRYAGCTKAYSSKDKFIEECPLSNLEFHGRFLFHPEQKTITYKQVSMTVSYPEAKVPMDPLVMES